VEGGEEHKYNRPLNLVEGHSHHYDHASCDLENQIMPGNAEFLEKTAAHGLPPSLVDLGVYNDVCYSFLTEYEKVFGKIKHPSRTSVFVFY
jgi:hypothetical protein